MLMKNMEDFMLGVGVELVGGTPRELQEKEASFLAHLGTGHRSLESLVEEAVVESQDFRRGLKEAMLVEGVEAVVVEGLFKEAEEVMTNYMRGLSGESMQKEAFIGGLLRTLKQPLLEGVAHSRGLMGGGKSVEQGVEALMRSAAPGLARKAQPVMDGMHSGTLRMGLGNWLEGKGMTGVGSRLQDWGEHAMGQQASRLSGKQFTEGFNQLAGKWRQQVRTPGGVLKGTEAKMQTFKNLNPGLKNDLPGAVPANVVERAKGQAEQALAGARVKNIGGPAGGAFRFTPGRGIRHGLVGAGAGTLLGGPAGGVIGGMGGLATGTLGLGGAALAGGALGAGGLYAGARALGGGSGTDETGLPKNRNQLIPGVGNNWTGALGGALLASTIGREMGLEGPMAALLPLLGGVAGYRGLPGLMNTWQDPKGMGANAIPQIQRSGNQNRFGYNPQP